MGEALVGQWDYAPNKRSLSGSIGPNTRQGRSWVTKQDKSKRETSSKEGCEKSSPFWDEGRLIVRCKSNWETAEEAKVDSDNCSSIVLIIYVLWTNVMLQEANSS